MIDLMWLGWRSWLALALGVLSIAFALVYSAGRKGNFPYLEGVIGPAANLFLHDVGHAISAVWVGELARFGFAASPFDAYQLGCLAAPIAQEAYDYVKYRVVTGKWGWPSGDSAHDAVTYQGAWIVPLIGAERYLAAGAVLVLWIYYLRWWAWGRNR